MAEIQSRKILQMIDGHRKHSEGNIDTEGRIGIRLMEGGKEKYANRKMIGGTNNQINLA